MKRCDRRAQIKLSFGMMFSVILIAIFLGFTFYAIKMLLGMNDAVSVGKFYDSIQDDVDRAWKSSQGAQEETYRLPDKIEKICFIDYSMDERGDDIELYNKLNSAFWETENLIFYPVGSGDGQDSITIKHINLPKTVEINNPLCFKNINSKVTLTIKKEYGEQLVRIE